MLNGLINKKKNGKNTEQNILTVLNQSNQMSCHAFVRARSTMYIVQQNQPHHGACAQPITTGSA